MTIESPFYLLLLVPWAILSLWLLRRPSAGNEATVPFVDLWRDSAPAGSPVAPSNRLPLWVALVLLAGLATILAISGIYIGSKWVRRVNLIVDRGLAMSAVDSTGATLTDSTLNKLFDQPETQLSFEQIVFVPAEAQSSGAPTAAELAGKVRPSAIDTTAMISPALEALVRRSDLPIILITNQPIEAPKAIVVSPTEFKNAGIRSIAAVEKPQPQVMVEVFSDIEQSVTVDVMSGEASAKTQVVIPQAGEKKVFLDLESLGEIVEAKINAADNAIAGDDMAWLSRRSPWPRLVARDALPPELSRLISVYSEQRAPDETSLNIQVATELSPDVAGSPAIIVQKGDHPAVSTGVKVNGTIGENLSWQTLARGNIGPKPDGSWTPIVTIGEDVLVAERLQGSRQVLVNFWSSDFANESDFVVLFGQIIETFTAGPASWQFEPMHDVARTWKRVTQSIADYEVSPGVYRDDAGLLHAVNATCQRRFGHAEGDWRSKLRQLPMRVEGGSPIAMWLMLLSLLLCMAGLQVHQRSHKS